MAASRHVATLPPVCFNAPSQINAFSNIPSSSTSGTTTHETTHFIMGPQPPVNKPPPPSQKTTMQTNTKKPHNNPPKKPQPSSSGSWAEKVRISDAATRFTLEPLPRLPEGHRLRFTDDMLMETSEQWNRSMVGFFPGMRMPHHALQTIAMRVWKQHGLEKVISMANGFSIFQFSFEEQVQPVIEMGPWLFGGKNIILQKWHPRFIFDKNRISTLPVWVRLHGLPFPLWSKQGLSLAASMVGTPLSCDEQTFKGTRLEYARICVEIDASLPYVHKFEIDTPLSPVPATVEVTYEWKPSRCTTCKVFGHACPTPAPTGPEPTVSILGNDPIPKPTVDQASSMQQEQQTLSATAKAALSAPSPNVQSQTSSYQTNNPATPHPETKSPLVTSQLASQHPVTPPTYQQNSNQFAAQATPPPVTLVPLQHAPSTQLNFCVLNTRDTIIPSSTPPIPLQAMQDPSPDMLLICQAEDQHNVEPMNSVQATGRDDEVHLPLDLMVPLNSCPPASPIPPPPNIPNTTTLNHSPICNSAKESNKASSSSSPQVKKKRGSRKRRGGI
ncbi:GLYCINE-RICH CELL WALL STRUCTURAL PROTEIN 1.8-LIKE [Salix viminalis]|uniref:GLYCINE-RICH CELL WALL STRUCTURAL PROTEIN 1.8-LIKE n=1 Tax=Salix viminalis TaxID=40686 RepID=A0A9Q0NHY6_SALVM|nr:GLYCINE-RICH CELL WALL STRUCTURAL PROTEIN 1.8-LIKE [Salix viminalis]